MNTPTPNGGESAKSDFVFPQRRYKSGVTVEVRFEEGWLDIICCVSSVPAEREEAKWLMSILRVQVPPYLQTIFESPDPLGVDQIRISNLEEIEGLPLIRFETLRQSEQHAVDSANRTVAMILEIHLRRSGFQVVHIDRATGQLETVSS